MSTDPKAIVRRYYEILNDWNPDDLDDLFAPDARGHAGAGADLEGHKASLGRFLEAVPDLRADVRALVAENGTVSAWFTIEGTHEGTFAGVPASGNRVEFAAWDLFRVEGGRIVEITSYCDLYTLMQQIGAIPAPSPA